jgi:CRISPR-associated protein Cst2
VGLFPFQGDRDLGTRSFERFGQAMTAGGNMFETELYTDLFKGTILVELDRVGIFKPLETGQNAEQMLQPDERRKRLQTLFEALNLLWGGGRTARMLADLSPKFVAYARLRVKHPAFLEALVAHYEDGKYVLDLEPLVNALNKFAGYIEHTLFGLEPGVFGNEERIRSALSPYGMVLTVHEALTQAKQDVGELWSAS